MTESDSPSKTLQRELARLEQEVRVPVVPGEGESWCHNVSACLEQVLASYVRNLEGHRKQIDHISEMHSELAAVANRLKARERELHASIKQLLGRIGGLLTSGSEAMQPDDVRRLNAFREDILSWIVASRTFDAELETWILEAAYRDYGGTD